MEPTDSEVTRYVIETSVMRMRVIDGIWFAQFFGSRESLGFTAEKPFEIGDKIKITIEKVNDDQPNQPSEQ